MMSIFVASLNVSKNLCGKPPKNFSGINPPLLEILFLSTIPTNRRNTMQGKVEICGVNTSNLTVLSQVEMDTLLRRAREGDKAAREKLIEGNLRLVLSVIQRFDKRGENPDRKSVV